MVVQRTQEDIQRMKVLNEARNPRQTIPNEASQMLNPLTGREYETDSSGKGIFWKAGYETGLAQKMQIQFQIRHALSKKNSPEIYISSKDSVAEEYYLPLIQNRMLGEDKRDCKSLKPIRVKPFEETTDYLEMQKRLGQMELRERSESEQTPFTREDYIHFADDLVTIAEEFNNSDILTLKSVRDATGLDMALKGIEARRSAPSLSLWSLLSWVGPTYTESIKL